MHLRSSVAKDGRRALDTAHLNHLASLAGTECEASHQGEDDNHETNDQVRFNKKRLHGLEHVPSTFDEPRATRRAAGRGLMFNEILCGR